MTWLPNQLLLAAAAWPAPMPVLVQAFEQDFVASTPLFQSMEVKHNPRINTLGGVSETLWHIITHEDCVFNPKTRRKTLERVFDVQRARRLPWCRALIENNAQPEIQQWEKLEGNGQTRTYIRVPAHNYVVILQSRIHKATLQTEWLLITAFHINHQGKRDDFDREYLAHQALSAGIKKAPHDGALALSTRGR